MASNAIDVLVIELLQKEARLVNSGDLGRPRPGGMLWVKTLFETVKNLMGIGSVIRRLSLIDWYGEHIINKRLWLDILILVSMIKKVFVFSGWSMHPPCLSTITKLLEQKYNKNCKRILNEGVGGTVELVVNSTMTNSFPKENAYSSDNPYCVRL